MKQFKEFEEFAKGKLIKVNSGNTCVIYTRVSTREQAENNMSLDTQRRACDSYARKHGYKVMAYFGGTYESAKTDEREEFNHMLSFVQKSREKIAFIIVYSVDRFSRSGANAIYITEQLKHNGISVVSVTQPTDVSTPSGSLQQNIQFIFSEYDNQLRREKSMAGMRDKLLRGEWCVKPPRGYDIVTINGKRSIVLNKDSELIRKVFLWKLYERLSLTEIRDKLIAGGMKVGHSYISNLLRNPFYCGILSNKLLAGKVVAGKHEKLVSQEIFLAVNELLKNEKKNQTKHTSDNENLPLRRMIVCAKCNTNMTGYLVKKKGLYYYKCTQLGCCTNKSAVVIHNLFTDLLNNIRLNEKKNPGVKKKFVANFIKVDHVNEKSRGIYKANLTVIKQKLEAIEERFALGEINESIYKKYKIKLEKEKNEVEIMIDKTNAGLTNHNLVKKESDEIISKLKDIWLKGDLQTKRIIQSSIFPEGLVYEHGVVRLFPKKMAEGFYFAKEEQPVKTVS